MKIVSKFRDYYDNAIQAGMTDDSLIFKRFTKIIETTTGYFQDEISFDLNLKNREDIANQLNVSWVPYKLVFQFGIVYFCGKVYPYIRTNFDKQRNIKDCYYYSYEALLEQYPFIKNFQKFTRGQIWFSNKNKIVDHFNQKDSSRWISREYKKDNDTFIKELIKKQIAYAVRDKQLGIIYYPKLKDFEFFKVLDLYTCLQTLEQYLTNELQPPDLVDVKIPDKLKVHSHGFNKWSFRKEPTKKK